MLNPSRLLSLTGMLLFSLVTALAASAVYADPPGRVAHLSHTRGEVSYSPAGEDAWLDVVRNRPLIRGDRLWTDRGARAEFQVSSAAVRLGSDTSVEILDLSDRIAQVKMTQGTLNLSVRRMHAGQILEVDTPMLAFTINRAGRYRIDVNPRNAVTTVVVWEGAGEAYGDNSSFQVRAGDTVRFYDTDLRDYEMYGLPREDNFDRYCLERDRRLERSTSLRYLDDDVVGYADLDEYGSWRPVRSYGNVWFPSRVNADWAPYRDGHWVWQEPWGWTWVDDAPWGFAPSHYGRWVNVSNRWGWVPGPRNVRPVYAPALVAFVGGSGWSVSISLGGGSPIGWFPLGPREVYVPSYRASRDYFKQVNVTNTVINNTIITNVYNNYSSGTIHVDHARYANRTVAGAVTAVPSSVFVNAQPVRPAAIRLDRKAVTTGEITRVAPIAPSVRSVIGTGKAAGSRPSREAFDRQVFVRNAPPPGERPFAAREQQLQKNPGRVPEPSAVKSVPGRDDDTAQKVRVIGEQRDAVDARAAEPRRGGGKPGTPSAAPGQLRPLDRSVEPAKESGPGPGDRGRGKEQKGQDGAQQQEQRQRKADSEQKAAEQQQQAERQRQAETQQQEQRQRKADSEQKAAEQQQQAEHQRQVETQQQEQRQRKADSEQKAAEQQKVEHQRQVETQQQEQRQRKADSEQKAAEQQQAERQRQAETQQQEQRQRKADSEQKAAEQQKVEHQRQVETQQQEQRQRKADSEQKAAEQQKVERQRQVETQQQEQRQRKADSEQKAAEQQKVEHQRQVETQQQEQRQRKADSEQKAAEQQKVEHQRQAETQQQEQRQRKADSEQKAAEQQKVEHQRQVETQQQEQRQRKADSEQKAAEQQKVERQRQVETQQQEQRQRKADSEQKAAEQQKVERQRQAETQQQEQRQRKADSEQKAAEQKQAECERQAIQQHQDVSQCRSETQPQENTDSPNRGKNRK